MSLSLIPWGEHFWFYTNLAALLWSDRSVHLTEQGSWLHEESLWFFYTMRHGCDSP
jgi:hypothetical protein